jgi:XRE family transcriptional regulator, regulator of sulfur utilization
MITRRDGVVALVAVVATSLIAGAATTSAVAILPSQVFTWSVVPVKQTPVGSVRQFLRAPTATLDELELHVTTLKPGETSHAPHKHLNEELIILKEGTVEVLSLGEWKRVDVGSVVFNASNDLHALRNVGSGPATYHVINWSPPGMKKK